MTTQKHNGGLAFITTIIITSLFISYVHQMSPAPLLGFIAERFNIVNNDALLNMSISITYPMTIIFSILGGSLEPRIGVKKLFIVALFFNTLGLLINFILPNYTMFLIGRALYGIGFGLAMPFFGTAIMKWYTPLQREKMNTVNGLFPFLGAITSYMLMVPLYKLLGNSVGNAYGVWGVFLLIFMLIWIIFVREPKSVFSEESKSENQVQPREKGLYFNLLKRRSIRLLCITFFCDFICYSFIATVLPTYLYELGGGKLSEGTAGIIAALAFPGVGIISGSIGGMMMSRTGLRKPTLIAGQALKMVGFLVASLGASVSIWWVLPGAMIFGIGNAIWIPAMYTVPMDLEDMNPTRAGAAFSLITSTGFAAGAIAPIFGGFLTNQLMLISGIPDPVLSHIFGIKWCLFIFSFINVIGLICMILIKESGTKRRTNLSGS